jgi:NADH-quinone oxidoreductase subunit L
MLTNGHLVWLILFAPLLAAGAIMLGTRRLPRVSAALSIGAVVLGFALSLKLFVAVLQGQAVVAPSVVWLDLAGWQLVWAATVDRLSALMLLVVTGVGATIHVYSLGYMRGDAGFARFFGCLSLFMFSMLGIVLAANFIQMFIFWELVGVSSYLLIGFWFERPSAAEAGKKAFIVNRIGDVGFLAAMMLLLAYGNGSVDFDHLRVVFSDSAHMLDHAPTVTLIALLLFVGAAGKSAQIPLYIWLPDAMAGPTPVSALIHAATMVTAGVYMIARMNFLFALTPHAMTVVMMVGATTALVAASIGLVQNDIKKVLAYSTVSQLGFMIVAVGAGAYAAGVFHLMTHAFFKGALFLGAGAVIHALHHEQDIRKMGGLKKKLPIIHWTFLISCIAIAGLPPLAGFFSKDAILAETLAFRPNTEKIATYYGESFERQARVKVMADKAPDQAKLAVAVKAERDAYVKSVEDLAIWRKVAFALCLLAAFMTAFYMFRLYFLTFSGDYRGDHHTWDHAHDAPWPMATALVLLAFLSFVGGWVGTPFFHNQFNFFFHWLEPVLARGEELLDGHMTPALEYGLMAASTVVAALGVTLAWWMYRKGPSELGANLANRMSFIYDALLNKYYVDEFYDRVVVRPLRAVSQAAFQVIDRIIVDLVMVRGPGYVLLGVSHAGRLLQNGEVQTYLVGVVLGIALLAYYLV